MRCSYFTLAIFSVILTACGSKPVSYLPTGTKPIVNIEANIAPTIKLTTASENFSVSNLAEFPQNIAYKLFWYDRDGVTQTVADNTESTSWQNLWLQSKQTQMVTLIKPTLESVNYRLYLRKGTEPNNPSP